MGGKYPEQFLPGLDFLTRLSTRRFLRVFSNTTTLAPSTPYLQSLSGRDSHAAKVLPIRLCRGLASPHKPDLAVPTQMRASCRPLAKLDSMQELCRAPGGRAAARPCPFLKDAIGSAAPATSKRNS